MVKSENPEVIKRLQEDTKIPMVGSIPSEIKNDLQPVLISNPIKYSNIVKEVTRSSTGSATIYTAPSDRDFYITSASLSLTANGTANGTSAFITATTESGSDSILHLVKQTTTAGSFNISNSFPIPIKITRGSTITVGHTFTAGSQSASGVIIGYIVDTLEK